MHLTKEDRYIRRRLRQARKQARQFYYCRKYPINPKKIVFTTIEGTTGFSCNPKYIALELLRRRQDLDLVWLVDDMAKEFPPGIRKVRNTLQNRAYELSTAAIWVDNSRKQLECRKRPGQFYLQTWHAGLALKPIGMERGKSFSRIAYLVSKHDSNLIDYALSNSEYYEMELMPQGWIYAGPSLRLGFPRCDILVNKNVEKQKEIRKKCGLQSNEKIVLYAPTFRGGSQTTVRKIYSNELGLDYEKVVKTLEACFGGNWSMFLRLHPQLTVRDIKSDVSDSRIIDVSQHDDMYELLMCCDALITDYSCVSFDAMYMGIPIFLFVPDLQEYEKERGKLLWNLGDLPFPYALSEEMLHREILNFNNDIYQNKIHKFIQMLGLKQPGDSSRLVVDFIENKLRSDLGGHYLT